MSEIHEAYVTDVISSLRYIYIVMHFFLFVSLSSSLFKPDEVYCNVFIAITLKWSL